MSKNPNKKLINLNAKDTIAINSEIGNINVLNSIDEKTTQTQEKHANATINATAQNEFVETGQTVIAVEKSAEQLKRVKQDYDNYKSELNKLEDKLNSLQKQYDNKEIGVSLVDIQDLKDVIGTVKSQEKYYQIAITAATAVKRSAKLSS